MSVAAATLSTAYALAPGPWRLMSQGAKSGLAPKVFVQGRWTYVDEYGPSSGVVERYPIPKRLAFVVDEMPRQRVHIDWSTLCYANGERRVPLPSGSRTGIGKVTIYPPLYAQRVECDPHVVAKMFNRGTLSVRIYAY